MAFKTFTVGEVLTASDVNRYLSQPRVIRKSADESVTSSTAFQDDDHLVFTPTISRNYIIEYNLLVTGATGGDIKWQWTYPANCSITLLTAGPDVSITGYGGVAVFGGGVEDTTTPGGAESAGLISAAFAISCYSKLFVSMGATAGNVVLQWAQNASSGTATTVRKNSYLVAMEAE